MFIFQKTFFFISRIAIVLIFTSLPSFALELVHETWKDYKVGDSFEELSFWNRLSSKGNAKIVESNGKKALLLTDGIRLNSKFLAPFPKKLTLKASWAFLKSEGAMGIGFVDFSYGNYYYLAVDASESKLLLQKGVDGETSELKSIPFSPGNQPHSFTLNADFSEKETIAFTVLVGGKPVISNFKDENAAKMGSTFHIYFGTTPGTETHLFETTSIFQKVRGKGFLNLF